MKLLITSFFICCINLIFGQEQTSLEFQTELNDQYADSVNSPLLKEDLLTFKGLPFFEINTKLIVEAKFIKTKKEKKFKMRTTTERLPTYVKYGVVYFNIEDKKYSLEVYQNPQLIEIDAYKDYLFLPFTDATNGTETYGGGRYLDLKIPKKDTFFLDFNKAYNPYCSYNKKYSCPIVPIENDIHVRIEAGVKYLAKD